MERTLAIIKPDAVRSGAVGAIISDIPMVDRVDVTQIHDGDHVVVEDGVVTIG